MKRKLAVGAVLSASALLAGAIQVSAGMAYAAPNPASLGRADQLALAAAQAPAAAKALGLGAREKLVVKDAVVDADGTRHFRYERTYDGLPVLGGDLVVHQAANGRVKSSDKAVAGSLAPASLSPKLTAGQAAAQAAGAVRATVGLAHDADEAALASVSGASGSPELVVWAADGAPRLAYRTTVEGVRADGTPSRQRLVTDADSGAVLSSHEDIQTANANGTGNGVFVGSVSLTTTLTGTTYTLKDATRGGQYTSTLAGKTSGKGTLYSKTTNTWGNGLASNSESAAVDAQYGAAVTWDFYKNTFGRSGIRNDGVGAYSRVHYGSNYVNAFWEAWSSSTPTCRRTTRTT